MPVKLTKDIPATKRVTSTYLTDDELRALQRAVERDGLDTSEAEINFTQLKGSPGVSITLRTDRSSLTDEQELRLKLRSAVEREVERLDMVQSHCSIAFTPDQLTGLPRTPGYDDYCFQLRITGDWAFDERETTAGTEL